MKKSISFPNTVSSSEQESYTEGIGCDEIKTVMKSGEMALIAWYEVWKDEEKIAEIKESVCNVFYIK